MPDLEEKLLCMTEEAAVLSRGALAVYANAAAKALLGPDCVGKRIDELFGELVNGVQAPDFLAQSRSTAAPGSCGSAASAGTGFFSCTSRRICPLF